MTYRCVFIYTGTEFNPAFVVILHDNTVSLIFRPYAVYLSQEIMQAPATPWLYSAALT